MGRTAAAIASVPASRPWRDRIVVGCWNVSERRDSPIGVCYAFRSSLFYSPRFFYSPSTQAPYVELCKEYLPGFPVAFIGWSLLYASKFLREPNVNFNLIQQALAGPCGTRFMAAAHRAGRSVFAWTVNEEEWMEWCIRKGVDGVITDDPKLFLEVCERWCGEGGKAAGDRQRGGARPSALRRIRQFTAVVIVQLLATLMTALLFYKSGVMERKRRRKMRS